jgi:HK97 family phage major capsid protein
MEVKELADKIQGAVDALHKAADLQREEAKKFGESTAETKQALSKINERIDEVQLEMKRQAVVKPDPVQAKGQTPQQKAFWEWLRVGRANMHPDNRKALVEDATGAVLIPEDLDAEITRALPALTPIAGLCYKRPTVRDRIRRRSLNEVTVAWGKLEAGAMAHESSLVPTDDFIFVEDMNGLTRIGRDELEDTDYNLQAHVASSFAQAIAVALDKAILIGTGHTYQEPEGIGIDSTLLAGIGSGAGAGAAGVYGNNWTTDDTVTVEDILECEYALPTQYLQGATWVMHRKTELALRVLRGGAYTATDGPFLWQPSLQVGQPNTIDGYPVVNSSFLSYPADTLAKTNVIFGNFQRGYVVVERSGIRLQRLDELFATQGMVGFMVSFRAGGGLLRYDTFQLISNDT